MCYVPIPTPNRIEVDAQHHIRVNEHTPDENETIKSTHRLQNSFADHFIWPEKKKRSNNQLELMTFTLVWGAGAYSVHKKQFLVKSNRFICKSLNKFPSNSRKWNATPVSPLWFTVTTYNMVSCAIFGYSWHVNPINVTRWRLFKYFVRFLLR